MLKTEAGLWSKPAGITKKVQPTRPEARPASAETCVNSGRQTPGLLLANGKTSSPYPYPFAQPQQHGIDGILDNQCARLPQALPILRQKIPFLG